MPLRARENADHGAARDIHGVSLHWLSEAHERCVLVDASLYDEFFHE